MIRIFKITILIFVGIGIGSLITFYWNYISRYFANKYAFALISLLIIIILIAILIIAIRKIQTDQKLNLSFVNSSFKKISLFKNLSKEEIETISKNIKQYLEFSFYFRLITISILTIGTILGATIAIQQNSLFADQNSLFSKQNLKLNQQTNLIESNRRSALVFLFGNVLDLIDSELKKPNNVKRLLSNELVGRISALSQSLKPYKYLENDSTLSKFVSPERGQLLLSLINSNINNESLELIYRNSNFSFAEITNFNCDSCFFKSAILHDAVFKNGIIKNSNFSESNLKNIELVDIIFQKCNFQTAFFDEVKLVGSSTFVNCDFTFTPDPVLVENPIFISEREDWFNKFLSNNKNINNYQKLLHQKKIGNVYYITDKYMNK